MSDLKAVSETTRRWANQRQIAIDFQPQTGSTNDNAKAAALSESSELKLYLTDHQTAGRGRGSNTWSDTGSGEGLLSTWSFALPQAPQAITGPRIGLALFAAAHAVWPSLEWGLKAPNDLYLNGRKVGGLLLESVTTGKSYRLLIGLGLNILNHPRTFKQAEHLTSSLQSAPTEGEWFQFLDEWVAELQKANQDILKSELTASACKHLCEALNSNPGKAFTVQKVSPAGDLIHAQGVVRWIDL